MASSQSKYSLAGKHATIFAYGQTGSGKSFTMQGEGKRSGQAGIIQLVASDIFRFMRQGGSTSRNFVVKVSYIEIYNESIRDLLSEDAGSTMSHGTTSQRPSHLEKVNLRATASGEMILSCIQNEVTTVDQVLEYLIAGNSQRMVAKTDMNKHSSRSHALFRLTVESRSKEEPADDGSVEEILRVSDFNLVDLAGSESVKMSNTAGIRLREGAKINQRYEWPLKSLSDLWKVII
jgi:centromeric protein E